MKELPCDIAVCAAAVADWRMASQAPEKLKKTKASLTLDLEQNRGHSGRSVAHRRRTARPSWSALPPKPRTWWRKCPGQAARSKGCDWIVANDVSPASGTFGGQR